MKLSKHAFLIIFYEIIAASVLLGGAYFVWWIKPLVVLWVLFMAFTLYFFRDPERNGARDENKIICPADGVILAVDEEVEEPYFFKEKVKRISIFMSLFNVHVNRAPLTGKVEMLKHYPGKFFNASFDKASKYNEHTFILINTGADYIGVKQIAGFVARRIVTDVKVGDEISQGQRIGMIRFGSRVEVFYKFDLEAKVKPGDKVNAGLTVLGEKK